jgi:hypothetical protein
MPTHLSLLTDLTILLHIKQNYYCIYVVRKIHGLFFQCSVPLLPLRQSLHQIILQFIYNLQRWYLVAKKNAYIDSKHNNELDFK